MGIIRGTGYSSVWNLKRLTLHVKSLCVLFNPADIHYNPVRLSYCFKFCRKETNESILYMYKIVKGYFLIKKWVQLVSPGVYGEILVYTDPLS